MITGSMLDRLSSERAREPRCIPCAGRRMQGSPDDEGLLLKPRFEPEEEACVEEGPRAPAPPETIAY